MARTVDSESRMTQVTVYTEWKLGHSRPCCVSVWFHLFTQTVLPMTFCPSNKGQVHMKYPGHEESLGRRAIGKERCRQGKCPLLHHYLTTTICIQNAAIGGDILRDIWMCVIALPERPSKEGGWCPWRR